MNKNEILEEKRINKIICALVKSTTSITVNSYEEAEELFTGNLFRRINVLSDDTPWGEGEQTFYTYDPTLPEDSRVAFMGIDFNYTE